MTVRRLGVLLLWLAACAAQAHRGNESQITLDLHAAPVQGRWSIGLHDLPSLLPLGSVGWTSWFTRSRSRGPTTWAGGSSTPTRRGLSWPSTSLRSLWRNWLVGQSRT